MNYFQGCTENVQPGGGVEYWKRTYIARRVSFVQGWGVITPL